MIYVPKFEIAHLTLNELNFFDPMNLWFVPKFEIPHLTLKELNFFWSYQSMIELWYYRCSVINLNSYMIDYLSYFYMIIVDIGLKLKQKNEIKFHI